MYIYIRSIYSDSFHSFYVVLLFYGLEYDGTLDLRWNMRMRDD